MTHKIFSAPMLLTENVVGKAGLGLRSELIFSDQSFLKGVGGAMVSSCSCL